MLEVRLDRESRAYTPGETLVATVGLSMDVAPREVQLELRWDTEGKGTSDCEVVDHDAWSELSPGQKIEWSVVLPRGPESMQGQLLRIQWSLRCRADKSEPISIPLVVSRTREPIRLGVADAWKT